MNLLRTLRQLAMAAVVLAIAVLAILPPAQAQVWDIRLVRQDLEKSHPICGGFYQGKWQPSCPNFARYEGPSSGAKIAPQSPPGYKKAELDLVMKGWYACPEGFERTLNAPYDAPNACNRFGKLQAMQGGIYRKAEFVSRLCKEGSFFDPIGGGQCWSCPPGYHRSLAPVTEWNACAKTLPPDFSFAKQERQLGMLASALDCKSGEFAGEVNGKPYCWSCPAGFERNIIEPVYGSKACQSAPRRATLLGNAQCQPGERRTLEIQGKQDVDAGGGCWRCPKGGQWTEADIQGDQACMMANIEYKPGIRVGNMDCPAGQEFDMLTINQQTLDQRLRNQGSATFLANPNARAGTGSAGSCWTCPRGTKRETLNHVLEGMACVGTSVQWYTAPFREPGLFRIAGAEQVAAYIVANRKDLIEAAIKAIAAGSGIPEETVRRETWDEIATEPGNSAVLKSVIFGVMMTALDEMSNPVPQPGRAALPDMKPLLNGFAEYIRARRTYIAQDSMNAYEAWEAAQTHAAAGKSDLYQVLANTGAEPPDFTELGMAGFLANGAIASAAGTAWVHSLSNSAVMSKLMPEMAFREYTKAIGINAFREATNTSLTQAENLVLQQTAKKQAQRLFAETLKPTRAVMQRLMTLGPQVIVSLATEIIMKETERIIKIAEARPKLQGALADARQTPDLIRAFRAEGGVSQMQNYWATGTSGASAPSNTAPFRATAINTNALPPNFKAPQIGPLNLNMDEPSTPQLSATTGMPAATQSRTAPGTTTRPASVPAWQLMPGAATDIGMGGGVLWVVGSQTVPGGFAVLRWNGRDWDATGGGAMRIDVDSAGNAFVVNDRGEIYFSSAAGWRRMPGVGRDIGVGPTGKAWVIGTNATPGGFGIYRWNAARNDWDAIPGGGVRVDVDPQGNAWVVNDAGDVFRFDGGRFVATPGVKARDIGIGADGSVFVVAADGSVNKWSGNAWGRRDIALDAITVSEKGVPFGINAAKQIWMGYP